MMIDSPDSPEIIKREPSFHDSFFKDKQLLSSIKKSNTILNNDKKYSLQPDMIHGWQPKVSTFQVPTKTPVHEVIPFDFGTPQDKYFQDLIGKKDPSVTYVGDRPKDSNHLKSLLKNKGIFKIDENSFTNSELMFNSSFESGNIDFV
jgi:hypothetical protein